MVQGNPWCKWKKLGREPGSTTEKKPRERTQTQRHRQRDGLLGWRRNQAGQQKKPWEGTEGHKNAGVEPGQTTGRRTQTGTEGQKKGWKENKAKRQEEKTRQEPRRGRKNPWKGTRLDDKEKNLEKEPKDEKKKTKKKQAGNGTRP